MGGNLLLWVGVGLGILGLMSEVTHIRLIKWGLRMGIGGLMMIVMNSLLPQYMVSLNLYTLGFSTLLGIPGTMTLYVLQMII